MRVRLVSDTHFSAAHRLHREDWDEERNQRVFDKCNNPNGHGHTYGLEVTVEGEIDPETGYVMDFGDLKHAVEEAVIRKVDRRHLNHDVDFLSGINPTAENIAVGIWKQLAGRVSPAKLVRITLQETDRNRVIYEGADEGSEA
jgi:6-pyruvoyltetrahydropterin/6-carboxytetrahydropterin synthase